MRATSSQQSPLLPPSTSTASAVSASAKPDPTRNQQSPLLKRKGNPNPTRNQQSPLPMPKGQSNPRTAAAAVAAGAAGGPSTPEKKTCDGNQQSHLLKRKGKSNPRAQAASVAAGAAGGPSTPEKKTRDGNALSPMKKRKKKRAPLFKQPVKKDRLSDPVTRTITCLEDSEKLRALLEEAQNLDEEHKRRFEALKKKKARRAKNKRTPITETREANEALLQHEANCAPAARTSRRDQQRDNFDALMSDEGRSLRANRTRVDNRQAPTAFTNEDKRTRNALLQHDDGVVPRPAEQHQLSPPVPPVDPAPAFDALRRSAATTSAGSSSAHPLSRFDSVASFGLLPNLTALVVAGGESSISAKGHHFRQMLLSDCDSHTRRLLALGKSGCAALDSIKRGMVVRFEKLKATRGRSTTKVPDVEFHLTDANFKVFTLTILSDDSTPPAFHDLSGLLAIEDSTIVNVKIVVHSVQANGSTLKLLCYDKSSSILVTFTGSVKARMLHFLSAHLNLTAPSAAALGYPVVLHNLQVSAMGGRHLRATGLTLFDAWAGETELPSTMADRFLDVNDRSRLQELTQASMHVPLRPNPDHWAIDPQALVASRTQPSPLLDVNNSLSLDNAIAPDYFIVCAGLSSVNVGKTRQGGVSIGLKLEDNSYAMWANSYGDSLAASLNLDVGRFNVLAHSGELRSHIEAMFPGLKR